MREIVTCFPRTAILAVAIIYVLLFGGVINISAAASRTNAEKDISLSDTVNKSSAQSGITEIVKCNSLEFYKGVFYSDSLGGSLNITPDKSYYTVKLLSVKTILLEIGGKIFKLAANIIHDLAFQSSDNITYLSVNGAENTVRADVINVYFYSFGAFGEIPSVTYTTYHNNPYGFINTNDLSVLSGTAYLHGDNIILIPDEISEFIDTKTQYILVNKSLRISHVILINAYIRSIECQIASDTYLIDIDYDDITVETPVSAAAEIKDRTIIFTASGEYIVTVINGSCITVIRVCVTLPDKSDESDDPDNSGGNAAAPDENGSENEGYDKPNDSDYNADDIPDDDETPLKPDNAPDIPEENSDDTNIIDNNLPMDDSYTVIYTREIDVFKVVAVTVISIITVSGLTAIAVIAAAVKKRSRK